MKFGRLLRTTAEELPGIQGLFVCYKQLKKQVKRLQPKVDGELLDEPTQGLAPRRSPQQLTQDEVSFIDKLNSHLRDFNETFMEKEEDYVIQLQRLQEALSTASTKDELEGLLRSCVDFHGDCVLLMHWSIMAYTGLVKILKKHHKRTGLLVRAPHLENVLSQPFCSTEVMSHLVNRAEEFIQQLKQRLDRVQGGSAALGSQRASTSHVSLVLRSQLGEEDSSEAD